MERDISENSLYIEKTLEHLLLAQLSQTFWRRSGRHLLEIASAEIDNKGFDVVLTLGHSTRHVQLKTMKLGGKRAKIDVNVGLGTKPSGCVLFTYDDASQPQFQLTCMATPLSTLLHRLVLPGSCLRDRDQRHRLSVSVRTRKLARR
jgi:hypothetical protein